jgi:aspartate racemase
MSETAFRTIGVLGGMGPAATAYFFQQLVDRVAAERDQSHPPCLIYNATQVPDRTAHLTGGEIDPTSALQEASRVLERAGADFIAIPCNSAHAYLAAIRDAVRIEVLDMIGLTAAAAASALPSGGRVGVLAASGTIGLGLYDGALEAHGLRTLRLQAPTQSEVMVAIRAVKAGGSEARQRLAPAIDELVAGGAELLIIGCTELPIIVDSAAVPVPVLDATEVLLRESLVRSGAAPSGQP